MSEEQTQEQEQEPVIVSIQLSLENVNTLVGILSKLPFAEVAGFIQVIRGQTIAQLQAQQPTEEAPAE